MLQMPFLNRLELIWLISRLKMSKKCIFGEKFQVMGLKYWYSSWSLVIVDWQLVYDNWKLID